MRLPLAVVFQFYDFNLLCEDIRILQSVAFGRAAAVFLDAKNVGINAFYGYGIILQI